MDKMTSEAPHRIWAAQIGTATKGGQTFSIGHWITDETIGHPHSYILEAEVAKLIADAIAAERWHLIATAPKDEEVLGFWQYVYHSDKHRTCGFALGEVNEDGDFVDQEGKHSSGLFTHWQRLQYPTEAAAIRRATEAAP